ncbi:Argininosuccinate lyase [hydrothermal vent metagenome]|uniref:Argininosuccinate lyase n=1 Tax=hydrothermal vent metagenome TaxID=652676 RepID=A0A3B0R7F1_9ZZZZ
MAQKNDDKVNPLWGGRFAGAADDLMRTINASIDIDQHMAEQDIDGSIAHVTMLAACKIIGQDEAEQIRVGLQQVRAEIRAGEFAFFAEREDIHMHVEIRLTELIGPVAGKLHTARSRNDQVATDFRLWLRQALTERAEQLRDVQRVLLARAEEYADAILPGLTHLQTAQPVTFGHHLMAYVEMFERDRGRILDAKNRLNESPLGAAALAGTAFDIDRAQTAKALGFDRPMANSLDAVSARDFALEALSAATICAVHLSRLADEMVYWTATGIGFGVFSDRFSTGSSIMPQKRNPDAAELVRAKSGRIAGAFQALVLVLKGLPLAYSKDMQEDKEPVFDAMYSLGLCLQVMGGLIGDIQMNREKMALAAGGGFATATDVADWLVREADIAFREAHHISGTLVRMAESQNTDLQGLSLAQMQSVEPRIKASVMDVLSPQNSAKSRTSYGGTAPEQVSYQINQWKERLK